MNDKMLGIDATRMVDDEATCGKVRLLPTIEIAGTYENEAPDVSAEIKRLERFVESSYGRALKSPIALIDGSDGILQHILMSREEYRRYVIGKYERCVASLDGTGDSQTFFFDLTQEKRETMLAHYRFALAIERDDCVIIRCPDGCRVCVEVGNIVRIEYGDMSVVGVVTELKPKYEGGRAVVDMEMAYLSEDGDGGSGVDVWDVAIDAGMIESGEIEVTRFVPVRSQSVEKLHVIVDYVHVIRALMRCYSNLLPLSTLSYDAVVDGLTPFCMRVEQAIADEKK